MADAEDDGAIVRQAIEARRPAGEQWAVTAPTEGPTMMGTVLGLFVHSCNG
jgi:hypothetical protein